MGLRIRHEPLMERPRFDRGTVQLWTWSGPAVPEWLDPDCLVDSERERAERIRHATTRELFLRGRVLLRTLLGLGLDCQPREVPIRLGVDGKPYLHGADWHFNISHSRGVLVLALSPCPVGVDIEVADASRDHDGLARRYFSPGEVEQYEQLPGELRQPAFLRGWTCKEAVVKAIGSGVRDLQKVWVDIDPRQRPQVLEHPHQSSMDLATWKLSDEMAGAVAVADSTLEFLQ